MALKIADRVRETTTTVGTGSVTLDGAVTGYQTFASVLSTADTTYYCIADQGGSNWEVGLGTFTSPSTLARTTILSSSNAGSVVTFGAGTKDVFITEPSSQVLLASGATMTGPLLVNSGGGGNVGSISGATTGNPVVIGVDAASADANAPAVIGNPLGTGYLSAQAPDSTATGGNTRGSSATDFQRSRALNTQIALGTASVVSGGSQNTATSNYTVVSGGLQNTVVGTYSWIPGGAQASTHSIYGAGAGSSGQIAAQGDAQWGKYILRGRAASGVAARLTADGAAAGSANVINIPLNTAWSGHYKAIARDTSTGNCAKWTGELGLAVQGTAATTTLNISSQQWGNTIGSVTQLNLLSISADTTNRGINATFQPPNTNTWDIVFTFDTGEVQ